MNWTLIGHKEELTKRMPRVFVKEGIEIGVFLLSDDRILAIENRCPHKKGPLSEGIVSDHFVFCPLHNWKINLEDGQVQKPDRGCVKTYPVKVREDQIWIAL